MGKRFKLRNGQLLLSTEAPGGVYSAVQLKKIAELCDGDSAMAKATEDQRLALFVAPEKAGYVAAALRSAGLGVRHYQDGLHQPINCVGELCPEHLQDAMGASLEIATELATLKLESPLKIGINGCARGCVASHTLDISILGDSGGYRICIGGKNSQIPEMAAYMADGVPSAKLPKLIAKIVSIYKELAEPGESLQEVIERHGASKFIAALAPYSQDASLDESSGGHPDLEAGDGLEELKLDDLGVTSQMRHDGPEIDMDLSDVELASEPTVDVLAPVSPDPVSEVIFAEEIVPREEITTDIVATAESVEEPSVAEFGMTEDVFFDESHVDEIHAEEVGAEEVLAEATHAEDAIRVVDMPSDEVFSEELITEDHFNEEPAEAVELVSDEPVIVGSIDVDLVHNASVPEELPFVEEESEAVTSDGSQDHAALLHDQDAVPMPDESKLPEDASLPLLGLPSPIQLLPPAEPVDDEFAADELNEEDADTFEQSITAQIAEDEGTPEVGDANSSERNETMELLGAQVEPVDPDTFEEKHMATSNLAPRAGSAGEGSAQSGASGFEFIGLDLTADGRISLQFASGAAMAIDPWALVGNSRRELRLAGKLIVLTPVDQGINVEVDGVSIFLPQKAAA